MDKNQNSKKRRIIGIVLIVLLLISCGVGGKLYMDHERTEEKKAALAYQAEKIIARQLKNHFTGITEINFKYVDTIPNGAGDWTITYRLKTTWDVQLDKRDQGKSSTVTIGAPTDLEIGLTNIDIMNGFGFGFDKSADAYDKHSGQTDTKIKVKYTNGKKETLNANK